MAGSFFVVTGGIGLVRMPDFFTRLHPSGLVDTMGATLIVAGLVLQAEEWQVSVKLLLVLVFLYLTGPTATHAVAHAALVGGLKPWTKGKGKDQD
ncbi:MAG: monovalent cation/H(+) antiporter subunit G [Proteobacteria bacterium]|nr:monovalent cation/H(+) antiporter subunit G [Pseudomonadota bacterium]